MPNSTFELAELSPEEMEEAYLEYRRACYDIVYRNCLEQGVLDLFSAPITFGEFAARLPVADNKLPAAQLLIDALVKYGALECIAGNPVRYGSRFGPPDAEFDDKLIYRATGKRSVAELRHSENYAGIINALRVSDNPVSATFDGQHLGLWEEVLQAPFYRYSRVHAVRDITASGLRMLDLACGPGFGLAELAESVGPDERAIIVGVEISPDFVASASTRNANDSRVHVTRGDLEQPLDFLQQGLFDGAMIVGAYHFLRDKRALWHSVRRLLRPGGVFCIAYALSQVGTYDQEIMNLRFSLRQPPSYQPTRGQVLELATAHGMELRREFGLGAWRWYSFERK